MSDVEQEKPHVEGDAAAAAEVANDNDKPANEAECEVKPSEPNTGAKDETEAPVSQKNSKRSKTDSQRPRKPTPKAALLNASRMLRGWPTPCAKHSEALNNFFDKTVKENVVEFSELERRAEFVRAVEIDADTSVLRLHIVGAARSGFALRSDETTVLVDLVDSGKPKEKVTPAAESETPVQAQAETAETPQAEAAGKPTDAVQAEEKRGTSKSTELLTRKREAIERLASAVTRRNGEIIERGDDHLFIREAERGSEAGVTYRFRFASSRRHLRTAIENAALLREYASNDVVCHQLGALIAHLASTLQFHKLDENDATRHGAPVTTVRDQLAVLTVYYLQKVKNALPCLHELVAASIKSANEPEAEAKDKTKDNANEEGKKTDSEVDKGNETTNEGEKAEENQKVAEEKADEDKKVDEDKQADAKAKENEDKKKKRDGDKRKERGRARLPSVVEWRNVVDLFADWKKSRESAEAKQETISELFLAFISFLAFDFDPKAQVVSLLSSRAVWRRAESRSWSSEMAGHLFVEDASWPTFNICTALRSAASWRSINHRLIAAFRYFATPIIRRGDETSSVERLFDSVKVDVAFEQAEGSTNTNAKRFVAKRNVLDSEEPGWYSAKLLETLNDDSVSFVYEWSTETILSHFPVPEMRPSASPIAPERVDRNRGSERQRDPNRRGCELCRREHQGNNGADECPVAKRCTVQRDTPQRKTSQSFNWHVSNLIYTLHERCEPTDHEIDQKQKVIDAVFDILSRFVHPNTRVDVFGSCANGFEYRGSDMDLCVTFGEISDTPTRDWQVNRLRKIADMLRANQRGPFRIIRVIDTARVPIIKFRHLPTQVFGDICLYNMLALDNTALMRTYSKLDSRVPVLGTMLKSLVKQEHINDASQRTLSSYAYLNMLIYFLQRCDPPVLPVLQELHEGAAKNKNDRSSAPKRLVDGKNVWYQSNLDYIRTHFNLGANTKTFAQLWAEFLHYYAFKFDFTEHVVAIRQSKVLTKKEKNWFHGRNLCFAIEDPFDVAHNLGDVLSPETMARILGVLRAAYQLFTDESKFNEIFKDQKSKNFRDLRKYFFKLDVPQLFADGAAGKPETDKRKRNRKDAPVGGKSKSAAKDVTNGDAKTDAEAQPPQDGAEQKKDVQTNDDDVQIGARNDADETDAFDSAQSSPNKNKSAEA